MESEGKLKLSDLSPEDAHDFMYHFNRAPLVSRLMKLKSLYMRLCLNNPIQTTAAHQTKRSMVYIFNYIINKGHQFKVLIVNCIHDEIVLEVPEYLAEEYKHVLGAAMRKAANEYLVSGLVQMKADANIGDNWYEAK